MEILNISFWDKNTGSQTLGFTKIIAYPPTWLNTKQQTQKPKGPKPVSEQVSWIDVKHRV